MFAQRKMNDVSLYTPPAAQTADSIALIWNKLASQVEHYEIHANDALVATTTQTDFTLRNLPAGKEYAFCIRTRIKGGESRQSNVLRVSTKPTPHIFDITAYGAIGDGKTLNTQAIQSAIDACDKGGLVRIPAGIFLSGAIFLKSEMTLSLDEGAVLLGSTETRDYPIFTYRSEGREKPCYASLVNTQHANGTRLRNITIAGSGTIDGNGMILQRNQVRENSAERGRLVCIRDTDGLYLQDVHFRAGPFWCVHPIYCNGVTINGVRISTKYDDSGNKLGIVNSDGIDPDSCRDVFIFDCDISSQDDCIALKSGRDAEGRAVGIPTENVRITHCRFHSGFGVAMGSEMSGGIRNVLVEDCLFQNTFSIASVKAPRGRGGVIENVTYRDCALINTDTEHHDCQWFRGAIYVDYFYGKTEVDPHGPQLVDDGTPIMRKLTFENITLDTVGGNAIYLGGLPESPLEDIHFENVKAVGRHGFIAQNVRSLTLDNVKVDAREGRAMEFINVGVSGTNDGEKGHH